MLKTFLYIVLTTVSIHYTVQHSNRKNKQTDLQIPPKMRSLVDLSWLLVPKDWSIIRPRDWKNVAICRKALRVKHHYVYPPSVMFVIENLVHISVNWLFTFLDSIKNTHLVFMETAVIYLGWCLCCVCKIQCVSGCVCVHRLLDTSQASVCTEPVKTQ